MDFNYYRKRLNSFNSQTDINTLDKYNQYASGIGLGAGCKYGFGRHFFVELKTSFLAKIFTIISYSEMNKIKPLNAQWANENYYLWWVTNFNIAYAF
jgi:hypothetical protein